MFLSEGSPGRILTTVPKRYAFPCWPRKFCEGLVWGAGKAGDAGGRRGRGRRARM